MLDVIERLKSMQIEIWPVNRLIPYARNARTHSDEQVAQVAASMRQFGWTNPILVANDNTIIAGHARVLAARKLGLVHVPVIMLGHLKDADRRAYILADNKLAENAGWDQEMLRVELTALREDGFDLDLIGFSKEELDAALTDPRRQAQAQIHPPNEARARSGRRASSPRSRRWPCARGGTGFRSRRGPTRCARNWRRNTAWTGG